MPKFTYSASKGIEQSSGSGFIINDVSIVEGNETITTGACNTYGVNILTAAGSFTLANGDTEGQKATFIFGATDTLTPDSGDAVNGAAAGEVVVLMWTGSVWVRVSA
tara:strand:- start:787 stop:1107 length:321 start_codon:yes stop_codon:yes gene_type:complete